MSGRMGNARELLIPQEASVDPKAVEIFRGWIAKEKLDCSLRLGMWEDVGAWGIVLADIARHVASGTHELTEVPVWQSLARIIAVFQAEIGGSTDRPQGSFVR